ncbi:MAG: AI-2E family transporter [Bdellovibrionales bacterium]|nr:AI-2E family transporter [Bdellovibrionales bacterium]
MARPTSREQILRRQSFVRLIAFLGVIGFTFLIILQVENMLVSCLLAFVMSYIIGPIVNILERKNVDRVLATTGLFVFLGLGVSVTGYLTFPKVSNSLQSMQSEAPKYIEGVTKLIETIEGKLKPLQSTGIKFSLSDKIKEQLLPATEHFFSNLPGVLKKLFTVLLLAPFFAFFMIKDGRHFSRNLLALVPNNLFELTYNIYHQINDQMGQFIRARLMEAGIVGLVTWLGLLIIKFPFSGPLSVIAAITNLIPYIGPVIGIIPALLLAMINGLSPFDMSMLLLVYFVAQLIDAAFIIPVVVAKIVDLHPVTVIVVIIIGAQAMGVVGMLISIPVASAMKVTIGTIFRYLTDYRV